MKTLTVCLLAACGGSKPAAAPAAAPAAWAVPTGWRSELIPFPLDFAPSLPHHGVEELRFAPGFFDPAAPGYWSYAFVWRLDDGGTFEPTAVASELTTYFRGLIDAVDEKHEITEPILVRAEPAGANLSLVAHIADAFKTKQPLDLTGTGIRLACPAGAVWVFTFAPTKSALRTDLDALAQKAACDQPPVPNPKKS